ncbi:896_t:CDS:2 [Entrophospora sp. SA101]|nr:896_t:CDS:2 [Entrophospora sp. SA101]CAJ0923451.1 17152_t:CDS:2 [Entrophospora sp. SA101]
MSLSATRERRANAGKAEKLILLEEKREEKEKRKKAKKALNLPPLSINLRKRKTDQLSNDDICNNSVKSSSSQKKGSTQSKRRNTKSISNNNLEDDNIQQLAPIVPILSGIRSSSRSHTLQSKQLLAEKLKEYEEKKLLYPKREKIITEVLTQEELLAEAKETEALNLASLKEFELRENEIKDSVRRNNRLFLENQPRESELFRDWRKKPQRLPAKYKDPKSGIPYANMEAYSRIQKLMNHQYIWYGKGCVYLNGPDQPPAKAL